MLHLTNPCRIIKLHMWHIDDCDLLSSGRNYCPLCYLPRCELQPHISRIPIRRAGSTETPPTHIRNTASSSDNQAAKEESATLKVWKLLKPGLQRHLSLSGMYIFIFNYCIRFRSYKGGHTNGGLIRIKTDFTSD